MGGDDGVVARYGADLSFHWVKRFGTSGAGDDILDICRIGASDLLILGVFAGSIAIGPATLTSNGDSDFYLARLDSDGNVKTVEQISGTGPDFLGAITAYGSTMVVGATSRDCGWKSDSRSAAAQTQVWRWSLA